MHILAQYVRLSECAPVGAAGGPVADAALLAAPPRGTSLATRRSPARIQQTRE